MSHRLQWGWGGRSAPGPCGTTQLAAAGPGGHCALKVDREVVGVCCLELCDLVTPQRFCPISVSVLELELVAKPQESLETD